MHSTEETALQANHPMPGEASNKATQSILGKNNEVSEAH
jgi:glycerate-2-kinase